jgi:hypothetical protein
MTGKSKFALHLLDNKHSMGPMENIMDVIYVMNKGSLYIYHETKLENQINNQNTFVQTGCFYILLQYDNNLGSVCTSLKYSESRQPAGIHSVHTELTSTW